jgi:hypothetical protein
MRATDMASSMVDRSAWTDRPGTHHEARPEPGGGKRWESRGWQRYRSQEIGNKGDRKPPMVDRQALDLWWASVAREGLTRYRSPNSVPGIAFREAAGIRTGLLHAISDCSSYGGALV